MLLAQHLKVLQAIKSSYCLVSPPEVLPWFWGFQQELEWAVGALLWFQLGKKHKNEHEGPRQP